ncbi:MAG: ABC-2 transporter permease [Erysipelotrichaceae bacterium]|nr:ABC-2 transporter permease [Erysipelotrichaceae bacterium]
MSGMIRKEICMILQNRKFLVICFAIYILYTFMFDMDMSFYLPFMAVMLSISGFSYDDYNGWQTYASALPKGKTNIVKAKYITALGLMIAASILGLVLALALIKIKGAGSLEESVSALAGSIVALSLMLAILFPILFKYGSEKGRMALYILAIGIAGITLLLTKVIKVEISPATMAFLESAAFPILLIVIVAVALGASYFISRKIYLSREF